MRTHCYAPAQRRRRTLECLVSLLVFAATMAQAGTLVQFRTVLGDLEVELLEDKPVTTRNFIRYVQTGAYADMFLHRWVPGFVAQGGGFAMWPRGATNAQVYAVPSFGEITNEFAVGRHFSNVFGTLAMAKTATGPNTATSQWFFNLADNSANLDAQNGGFTVFGRVLRGTNVLSRFNNRATTNHLYLANYGGPFTDVPVYSTNGVSADLLYTDITLLSVTVARLPANQREISWNSVAGLPNLVEFTTNFPPAWQILATTNGTGNRMAVMDAGTQASTRFYRVRVSY
jgi:cyclophilin family peptidyl-prolyl cis-trans isomerase